MEARQRGSWLATVGPSRGVRCRPFRVWASSSTPAPRLDRESCPFKLSHCLALSEVLASRGGEGNHTPPNTAL